MDGPMVLRWSSASGLVSMPPTGRERGVRSVLCWEGPSVVVRDPPRELRMDDMWEPRSGLAQGRQIDHWTT